MMIENNYSSLSGPFLNENTGKKEKSHLRAKMQISTCQKENEKKKLSFPFAVINDINQFRWREISVPFH